MGKMCGKRWLSFMLAACLLLAALAGCGNREKEKVTVATNSTDFYRFKEENGSLPDILTVRRFSLSDVEGWRDSLMDLSGTEIAASIHQSYLRSYTYSDGTVNWLPTCAEVDSIVINRPLLEKHGLSVPENSDYRRQRQMCIRDSRGLSRRMWSWSTSRCWRPSGTGKRP